MESIRTEPLRRPARWPSVAVVATVAALGVLALAVSADTGGADAFWGAMGLSATMLAFALVGAVVVGRQPRNAVGWVLCSSAVLLTWAQAAGAYISRQTSRRSTVTMT